MVKVIVHLAKAVVAVMAALLFSSCGFDLNSLDGDGNVITQDRNVTGTFTAVSAGKGLEVVIEQGQQVSVTVEADTNLQEHIKTELKGATLEITADTNIGHAKAKRITVVMPQIKRIESAGGATVSSKGTLKEDSIEIQSSGGSFCKASLDCRNVKSDSSGGAHTELSGTTQNYEFHASNGATVDAVKLKAENVRAEASSGANATVNPVRNLTAEASSGANINYVTTPEQLKQNANSGGNISKIQ